MKIRQEFAIIAIPPEVADPKPVKGYHVIGSYNGKLEIAKLIPLNSKVTIDTVLGLAKKWGEEEIIRIRFDGKWEFIETNTGKITFVGEAKRTKEPKTDYTLIDGWYWSVERD